MYIIHHKYLGIELEWNPGTRASEFGLYSQVMIVVKIENG